MFKISKQFNFSASHELKWLEEGHPCTRTHGHNYVVTVEMESEELDNKGMVKDYREFNSIKDLIDSTFDHRHLNDVLPGINPTAENIAAYLYKVLYPVHPMISAISVQETPKTIATYVPSTNN